MRRDVDFVRLRGLPGRRVVNARAGERIIAQGAPPGDLHVVVSGHVRLERAGAALADLGPGDLFGEVALYGGGTQPYDAVAVGAATLIAVPGDAAVALVAQAPKFALGLAQTLADRALQLGGAGAAKATIPTLGPTPPEPEPDPAPADPGSLLGGDLPRPPWEVAKQEAQQAAALDRSIPRPEAFWPKTMKCPVCDGSFQQLQIRDNFVEIASRDSDLYEHHRAINAMHYGIPVCTECYYAAFPDDFNKLLSTEVEAVRGVLKNVRPRVAAVDFKGYRGPSHARASFELAILCYGVRRPQYRKVAALYHRLAWLARAAGNAELERTHLATARQGYQAALDNNQVDDARTELLLTYLVADLSKRLGDVAEASRWASLALQHPQIGQSKMVADLAQQLRMDLRAMRAPS